MSGFKTKARTIELLGRKQIRDSITALSELIKNAYDADSTSVTLEFDTNSNSVVIADNGIGMSQDDIESKWLVLGTPSKAQAKEKTSPKGRILMGAKGIGRLAAATMGNQLWLLSKGSDGNWNILYIHWRIFENPYLSLDNITVPTCYNKTTDELLSNFDLIVRELIEEQKCNLNDKSWADAANKELYSLVLNDIENSSFSKQRVEKFVRAYNTGTILFIDSLQDDWHTITSVSSVDSKENNAITDQMYRRFGTTISALKHISSDSFSFILNVYIDNRPWNEDFSFIEEDYMLYDVKVEGEVKGGEFKGKLYAHNVNPELLELCNKQLEEGISVTSGISNWESSDCGRYKIKFCHIEGESNRSCLSPDDYLRVKKKLENTCGISVFRDGVRVLPYGEPENDFLHIEERRTKKASTYVFSHRNIFGRIDISSSENNGLEDKSSREGFIENKYYFYFVQTLQNLLIIIAVDYLSSVKKDSLGIQQDFVNKNIQQNQDAKVMAALEKNEKKYADTLIKTSKKAIASLDVLTSEMKRIVDDYQEFCAKCLNECNDSSTLTQLLSIRDEIQRSGIQSLSDLHESFDPILVNQRYERFIDESLLVEISFFNDSLQATYNKESNRLVTLIDYYNQEIASYIEHWKKIFSESSFLDPDELEKNLCKKIGAMIVNTQEARTALLEQRKHESEIIAESTKELLRIWEESNQDIEKLTKGEKWKTIDDILEKMYVYQQRAETLFDRAPKDVLPEYEKIDKALSQCASFLENQLTQLRIFNQQGIMQMKQKLTDLAAILDPKTELTQEQIIDSLRKENISLTSQLEVYTDLANTGLAAEIVNHEFNQLFVNVSHAITELKPYMKVPAEKYWLNQIIIGFRSISDRQNQLSPMYRSYSLRKTKVKLHDFIEDVCRFLSSELDENKIHIKNNISNESVVKISKSKFFPVISNLINNSIYWTLNQNERIIQFRFDEESGCLFIEDNGSGIQAIHREKIFLPFVSFKPNGRGLGLTISKRVMESQGHRLEIADDAEKELSGACFKIVLSKESMEV